MPGHPDYTKPEHFDKLVKQAQEYLDGEKFVVPEWRFVWQARKDSAAQDG